MKRNRESYHVLHVHWSFQTLLHSYAYKKELTYIVELLEVFYLMKKEIRTTKIKDRVRAPEMEGNRVRKRKKTAVFFRVSACRIFKIKKQKKKKIGKKVKSELIIKYNRGKTSMQIQNLRNRKRFSNSNRDLSQSSVCYNHILPCGYFSCEDKRKKN